MIKRSGRHSLIVLLMLMLLLLATGIMYFNAISAILQSARHPEMLLKFGHICGNRR
jgi:hypothetical protein